MINSIELKNFKCFTHMQIPLSELTIFAGSNAAGKSTVIQALLLADATAREKGSSVDVSAALEIEAGNPQALISQNRTETVQGDFFIKLQCDEKDISFIYMIDKLKTFKLSYEQAGESLSARLFYLNAERTGPRISYPAGEDGTVLSNGANAAFLIDRADMEQKKVPECLAIAGKNSKFSIQAESWMNAILGDISISVSTDYVKAVTDIRYGNRMAEEPVLPAMTGFGISYILSIVTAGLWCASEENAAENTVFIVENPEAHLHPAAQSRMGKFLKILSGAGIQVIAETHSEHIIDGARIQSALMNQTDSMRVLFFEKEENDIRIDKISIDKNGELSEWPKGFFDQKGQDLRELFQLRRKHADS